MMENSLRLIGFSSLIEYRNKIIEELGYYSAVTVRADKTIIYKKVYTEYFSENDVWHLKDLKEINNFSEHCSTHNFLTKNARFSFENNNINLEMKYIVFKKIFSNEWLLSSLFHHYENSFKNLAEFINTKYPNINSIFELERNKVDIQWVDWLNKKGLQTDLQVYESTNGKTYKHKNNITNFWLNVYDYLQKQMDEREEWEKDSWDIRKLAKYGIEFNYTLMNYYISFNNINNSSFKVLVKKYLKAKLLSKNNFNHSTAQGYLPPLYQFLNFISTIEPTFNDLRKLSRTHIERYIEHINKESLEGPKRGNSNSNHYIIGRLTKIEAFIAYIQLYDYPEASEINVKKLFYQGDKPKRINKQNNIKYIPDYVLDQIIKEFNYLRKEVQPIVLIMLHTGLRISDVLCLKEHCLIKLNNKYWIETNIRKTGNIDHRIPIDDQLASMISVLINESILKSNDLNNPKKYIFCRYTGRRKGRSYSQSWIRQKLCEFARERKITDEMGKLFLIENHCFRHTYAMKMLNSGVDIIIVQELLAHASPEMTLIYAKLLDNTKRKAFEAAVKNGVFSFNDTGSLFDESSTNIPKDILDMLWKNHKLTALDTPYGTCLERINGKCNFAKQPPCLTCNNGNPCRDLGVGIFDGDIKKYEIHIQSTKQLIKQGKLFNRESMVKENEELLKLYENIHYTIKQGNVIYGRLDRLNS